MMHVVQAGRMLRTQQLSGLDIIRDQAFPMPLSSHTVVLAATNGNADEATSAASQPALTGCPWRDVKTVLREVGLRPTRQREALGWILFGRGDRHATAEMLYEEAVKAKVPLSRATIYNTLHQFTDVGLLRQIAVDGSKTYFDTNVSPHHHFFIESENALVDIPHSEVIVGRTPVPPKGYEIVRIDVVVRLRRKAR
jgi:Fur family transcriptional regulator, iron response regulator